MFGKKAFGLMCAVALFASLIGARAMAQPVDKRTYFTFSQPVALPGVTLPAGQYLFRFVDDGHRVVQVLSADGKQVYGMFLTLRTERLEPASQPEVQFMETANGMPAAIKAWWYPGERVAPEFMFPAEQAERLTRGKPALSASLR